MKKILVAIFAIISLFSFTACADMIFDYDFLNQQDETPIPDNTVIDASKVIYYTTTDGKVINPKDFTNPIVYNIYKDGKGVLLCKNTIYTIPEGAFAECSNLKTVVLPEKVNTLYARAFASCSKLESVTLNKNLATIGERVFSDCTDLKDIVFQDAVEQIGSYAFFGCSSLTKVNISDLSAWCRIDFAKSSSNPLYNGGKLYFNGNELTSLTIPADITEVKQYAFRNYKSLTKVIIHDQVVSIGSSAFYGCSNLSEIYCNPTTPPTLAGTGVFDGGHSSRQIYVPSESVDAYKSATNWSEYADQVVADPSTIPSATEHYIEYTSTDGKIVTPFVVDFGANLIDNVYENGVGRIYFDAPVTKMGENAFISCSRLASIAIPESVNSIGMYAFGSCEALAKVDIENLSAWCRIDFANNLSNPLCNGGTLYLNGNEVKTLTIPSDITEIKNYAFYRCASLVSVDIHDDVTSIGRNAFYGCNNIESISIGNRVASIGAYAFYDCSSLRKVYMGENVTSIGNVAFYGCSSLTRVDITDLSAWCRIDFVKSTSNPLYNGGTLYLSGNEVKMLTIPSDITSIKDYTFYNCSSLTKVIIHDQVVSIGSSAFYTCSNLSEIYCNPTTPPTLGNASVFDGGHSGRQIYVPSESVDAYKSATNWSEYADQVVADPSISSISNYYIEYTSTDGNIVTPYAVDFGANLISNVYENGVGRIYFDAPVTKMGEDAFKSCSRLASIYIPKEVVTIGKYAFSGCTNLARVDIADLSAWCRIDFAISSSNPLYLAKQLYLNGDEVKTLTIPSDITEIKNYAFFRCASLVSVDIHDDVTSIGKAAFYGCNNIENIYIGIRVATIGASAFSQCTSLRKVYIGENVTSIGNGAFNGCEALAKVDIENLSAWCRIDFESAGSNPLCYGGILYLNGNELTSLTIPSDITSIKDYTFYKCSSLTKVIIHDQVVSIGSTAFYGCSNLSEIYCNPTTPPTLGDASVFDSGHSGRQIYVPSESVDAYKSATNWSEYANEIVADPSISSISNYYIEYTSTDGKIVTPYAVDFGANLIGNVYENGVGRIYFDAPVTKMGEKAFYNCSTLLSISIPKEVVTIGQTAFSGCTNLARVDIADLSAWCRIDFENATSNPLYYGKQLYLNGDEVKTLTIPSDITEIKNYVFYNCSSLKSISIPKGVITIGKYAFSGCTNLARVDIADLSAWCRIDFAASSSNPLYYGGTLYLNGNELTSLTIPADITEVKQLAFRNYKSLTKVIIHDQVVSIGSSAFYGCSNLSEVYCNPTTPPTLGNASVFDNGHSGRQIYVPSESVDAYKSATNWSEYADQVVADPSLSSISNYYIEYTSTDGKIVTPYAVDFGANLIDNVYENGVGRIYFDAPVTKMGENAFKSCSRLASIFIPKEVVTIGQNAFSGCTNLARVDIADLSAWCRIDFAITTSNPLYYGRILYLNGNEVKTLTIPSDITEIKKYAFYRCASLVSVDIHDDVTSIGSGAFIGCEALAKVDIENLSAWCRIDFESAGSNPIYNGGTLYLNGNELTSLTIPADITEVKQHAFRNYKSLTKVIIHDQVVSIGSSAFYGCSNLSEIYCNPTTPPTLAGTGVFDGGLSSRQIYVPSESVDAYKSATNWSEYANEIVADPSISSISNYYIEYTSTDGKIVTPYAVDFGANLIGNVYENGVGRIYFDAPVTKMGEKAFYNCSSLKGISIPKEVVTIGQTAFSGCTNLARVDIADLSAWCRIDFAKGTSNPLYYGKQLYLNGNELTSLTIPADITEIKRYTFYRYTSLTDVTIHDRVVSIGSSAFYGCSNLSEIYCYPTTPPTLGNLSVFDGGHSSRQIYVPSESVDAYKSATNWSEYADQIVATASNILPKMNFVEDASCGLAMTMVYVNGGTFTMGATAEQANYAYSDELPTHTVTLDSFHIAECEVTQAQWQKIMGKTIDDQISLASSSSSYGKGDDYPIYYVNYSEAQEFCTKLSALTGKTYRLPTEAEWEYAARGGEKSKGYMFSGSSSISEVSWYSTSGSHPVKQKKPNELGLYDMSGNAYEWVSDWFASYSSAIQTNPTGPTSGTRRVVRGGSWVHALTSSRVSDRGDRNPTNRGYDQGFRVVCVE